MPDRRKREPPRAYEREAGERRPARPDEAPVRRQAAPDFTQAARQRARKRRRHRRHVLVFFYSFLFLAVLGAAVVLSLTVLFKITDVDVAGSSRYSQEQIVEASGIRTGDNLFRFRTGQAAETIRQKLPYLGTVRVSRKFPARVLISVQEEKIWGAVKTGGRYVILGESGRALESAPSPPKNCTELRGLSVKEAKVGSAVKFADTDQLELCKSIMGAIQKSGVSKVTAVDFSQKARIRFVYDGRVTVDLGVPTDLDYKLAFAKSLLKNNIKPTEKGTLNLSVASSTNRAYFDPDYGAGSSQAAGK